jgi:transposase
MVNIFKDRIRSYIYYEYLNGKSATEAYKTLQQLPPEYNVARNTVKLWYGRFNNGDYSLSDHMKIGRPTKVDKQKIFDLIESDPTLTSFELAEKVGCSRSLVNLYLNKEGYVWKLEKWAPCEATPSNKKNHYDNSLNSLLAAEALDLNKYLVTKDKTMTKFKNYTYKHVYRKQSQPPVSQLK